MKRLGLFFAVLACAACAGRSEPPTVTLPPGVVLIDGVYHIPIEGVEVNGQSGFRLEPGWYQFATEQPGHRFQIHDVEIDSEVPRLIRVEPGQGFAVAEFTFTPEADVVIVVRAGSPDATSRGLDPPWRVELDAGRYRVEAQAAGQLPLAEDFEVLPNEPVSLDLVFTPRPTSAPLRITTSPVGAELFLDGAPMGEAPQNLEAVDFGTLRISAYAYADPDNRVAFEDELEFGEDSPRLLELSLNVEQRRFDGEWYERSEADRLEAAKRERERRAEEGAYREARTNDPVEVQLELPALADRELTTAEDFSRALFRLLRVGDRLRISLDGTDHLIWKRSTRTDATFRRQVGALWNNQPLSLDYAEDPVRAIVADPGASLITTVAYRLYRRLNEHPVLDLDTNMHDLGGLSVHTLAADGPTTLLAFGGAAVAVNGRAIEFDGELGFLRLAATDQELELTWDEAPQRVLIVSEKDVAAQPTFASAELNLNQKHVVELGIEGLVQSFRRVTAHPDGTWRLIAKERSGGLPVPMDLNSDEVGPHEVSGVYTREWLIDYEATDGKRATRQIAVDYTVGDVPNRVEALEFLRRKRR